MRVCIYLIRVWEKNINKIFCYFYMCFGCENRWIQVQIAIFSYFVKILSFWDTQKKIYKILLYTTPAGFEPARAEPNSLAGCRLNHSAKVSYYYYYYYYHIRVWKYMPEVGFEPTHPKITELKSAALDHSAIQAYFIYSHIYIYIYTDTYIKYFIFDITRFTLPL